MNLWQYSVELTKESCVPWDARRSLIIPGNNEEAVAFAASHLVQLANFCIAKKNSFSIALCGGSTPIPLLQQLIRPPLFHATDWQKWCFFWSDERNVPYTSLESNFGEAWRAGLQNVTSLEKGHCFPMPIEKDLDQAARRYEQKIRSFCSTLDLVMLGMGQDGHTASLFPGTAALDEMERWVVANYIPALQSWRMTFTFPAIAAAGLVCVYAFGTGKQAAMQKVLLPSSPTESLLPAARLGTPEKPVLFFLDRGSSASLPPSGLIGTGSMSPLKPKPP